MAKEIKSSLWHCLHIILVCAVASSHRYWDIQNGTSYCSDSMHKSLICLNILNISNISSRKVSRWKSEFLCGNRVYRLMTYSSNIQVQSIVEFLNCLFSQRIFSFLLSKILNMYNFQNSNLGYFIWCHRFFKPPPILLIFLHLFFFILFFL